MDTSTLEGERVEAEAKVAAEGAPRANRDFDRRWY
jgi:hypothetical protein